MSHILQKHDLCISTYPPGDWDNEILGQWDTGTMRHWDNETLGQWDTETMRHWDNEILGQWDTGTDTNILVEDALIAQKR